MSENENEEKIPYFFENQPQAIMIKKLAICVLFLYNIYIYNNIKIQNHVYKLESSWFSICVIFSKMHHVNQSYNSYRTRSQCEQIPDLHIFN